MLGLMAEKLYHDFVIFLGIERLKYKISDNILCGLTCVPDINRFNAIEFLGQLLNLYLCHICHEVQFYP